MVASRAFGRGLVLALLVSAAVLPASAQSPGEGAPVVGPELPVSRPVPGAPRDATEHAVAYGRGLSLVAWTDVEDDLWVTRVDRNGTVVDPSGILLSTGEYTTDPAVAFDGTNFLVVWDGSGPVKGRRVSPGGVVLDPAPIELSTAGGAEPAVSFGGGNHLVVWTDGPIGGEERDVFGTRLSPDGEVLQPANVPIVASEGNQGQIDIAFDGTHHLLVWAQLDAETGSADVFGTLVTTEGVAVGPGRPISAEEFQWRPVVTATGSGFFVAWEDRRAGGHNTYGARVGADGSVIDEPGILFGAVSESSFGTPYDVSWDGVDVLVTWHTGGWYDAVVRGARVDASGAVLDPGGVAVASGQQPVVAFDGTHHLVTSLSQHMGNLRGTRVTTGLAPLDPEGFAIAIGANAQNEADLVSDGVNHLVVWTDNREGRRAVYGARVGPDGQNLDGGGFAISVPGSSERATGASVAFDGTNFLVVWVDYPQNAVRAARVSRAGEVLDRFDVARQYATTDTPTLAFGNGMYLVGWMRFRDVMVTRVGTDGSVLDPEGILLSANMTTVASIDIAAGASEFLVVWNNGRQYEPVDDNNVYGAVVRPDGTVVASHIPIGQTKFPVHEDNPAVAWHDGTYLVVWSQAVDDGLWPPDVADISGARVDGTGAVLDPSPLPISTAPGRQEQPDIAFNGRYLVVWNDRRATDPTDFTSADVYGAVVDPSGSVGPEALIGAGHAIAGAPDVASLPGSDDFAVAYSRFLPDSPYGANRAFLRHVSPK